MYIFKVTMIIKLY